MSQIPGDNVFAQRQWKKSSFCGLKVPRLSKWLAAESIPYQSQERDAQSLDFCIKDNHFFQTLLPSFQLDTFKLDIFQQDILFSVWSNQSLGENKSMESLWQDLSDL